MTVKDLTTGHTEVIPADPGVLAKREHDVSEGYFEPILNGDGYDFFGYHALRFAHGGRSAAGDPERLQRDHHVHVRPGVGRIKPDIPPPTDSRLRLCDTRSNRINEDELRPC